MLRQIADDRFADWVLDEVARSKERVRELREKYPSAPPHELAQRLIDEKKRWAATAGAVSGLFGLVTLPADLALVAYLQMSLIVDIAVLCGRNVKSATARRELLDVFTAANTAAATASRASPKALSRLAERLLTAKGLRVVGRVFPVVAAPVLAAINHRDLEKAGEEAMRCFSVFPKAMGGRPRF